MKILATYIREHCIACAVAYIAETEIDTDGISVANMAAMHAAIRETALHPNINGTILALIDGNYFVPLEPKTEIVFRTVVGGDRTYSSIAAASILAKCARDDYIDAMCLQFPDLDTKYGLMANKGYGTKSHLAGISQHGISQFHRRTFGMCKSAPLNPLSFAGV
jgi:ribonuclease HII